MTKLFFRSATLFLLILSLVLLAFLNATSGSAEVAIQYQADSKDFPNPERGFYYAFDPVGNNPDLPLKFADLQEIRSQNITLIRRMYLISEFRNSLLSDSFLKMVSDDCETARGVGIKLIIRFTYNWAGGGSDAPRDTILQHLEQLKPVLQANYDVIAYMEAGFIGYWGEWHDSSNNLLDSITLDVTDDARTIFLKFLSVLPTDRMIAVRYPKQKRQIFNNENSLTREEAFSGSARSRTGHHNDGFRASIDDYGTYSSTTPTIIEQDKAWLNLDTQAVVQGGEPEHTSKPPEYGDCQGALADLARMHWSGMSINQSASTDVYMGWEQNGCMEEIKRRLGYRFRLIDSMIPSRIKQSETFQISFTVINDGWASPYNPRKVELILRNRETSVQYHWTVSADPRLWMAGETKIVSISSKVPLGVSSGIYDVLLNLPDPASSLYSNPNYSIRLANQNVWEPSTGYNSLLASIIVE